MASVKGSETRKRTEYTGVYIREVTDPRKLTNGRKKDFAFDITYNEKVDGKWKVRWAVVGWKSEGMDAEKAFKQRAIIQDRLAKGELTPKQEKAKIEAEAVTVGKFFDETVMKHQKAQNKSWKRTEARFNTHIRPTFGNLTFREITVKAVCDWRDDMLTRKEKLAEGTVSILMNILHQCFRLATNLNVITHNIFDETTLEKGRTVPKIRIPDPKNNHRERALTREEADLLIRKAIEWAEKPYQASLGSDPDIADMIIVALKHGLRAQEVCGLQWKDVVLEDNYIMLWDQKNGKKMPFRMASSVKELLEKRSKKAEHSPEDYVFPKPRSGKRRTDISVTFKKIVARTELNKGREHDPYQCVVFHTLRHTFGTWLAQSGVDVKTIQKMMRHADIKDTLRYMNYAPDYTDGIIEKLDSSWVAPASLEDLTELPSNVVSIQSRR